MNMIERLFTSFDPLIAQINLIYLTFLTATTLPLFSIYFIQKNRLVLFWNVSKKIILSELESSTNNINIKIKTRALFSLFILILLFNMIGLLPYTFTRTRQIIITLRISLPFWLSFVLFSIIYNTKRFLRHLVPLSSPLILSQFIVIIESISQIIRPITLAVRLCANITAGHILIALARKPIFILRRFSILLFILLILETAVAIIQRYVFTILISIYLSETTYEQTIPSLSHYFTESLTCNCRNN